MLFIASIMVAMSLAGMATNPLRISGGSLLLAAEPGSGGSEGGDGDNIVPALLLCAAGTAVAACALMGRSLSGGAETGEACYMPAVSNAFCLSDTKWAFLGNMTGEMRGSVSEIINLSAISLDAGTMRRSDYENMEKIYNSGVILSGLIDDIMETARTGIGCFVPVCEEYDTAAIINDAISINVTRMGGKRVKFSLRVDESFPMTLRGDALKVKHIFNNILSSAFRCTANGSVTWELYCERDNMDDAAVWVVSRVMAAGVGADDDHLREILSSVCRDILDASLSADSADLGLSVTKRMIEMMHGCVTVENRRRGGVFTARFRQATAGAAAIDRETMRNLCNLNYSRARHDSPCRMLRKFVPYAGVLVVDAIESNLDAMKQMLKPYGMRVDCVDSGQAAVELVAADDVRYDAILIDHQMPGMDGIETARLIRGIGTDYASAVPMIAVSSDKDTGNGDMFLKGGFQAFIAKPVDILTLNSVINRWVKSGRDAPGRFADDMGLAVSDAS
jgi:CheY-like chemotaxis protein